MNVDDFFGLQVLLHQDREPRVERQRVDPRETMSDPQFKLQFRFSKESVTRIAELIEADLILDDYRGLPLSPVQQVCCALNHYSGGHFQRTSALCGGVSQNAARLAMIRVTNALVGLREQFIFMPTSEQMEETCERMMTKFHLPRFAMAVDGMMVRFPDAPRGFPPTMHKQLFWCRKQFYALNVQVVGNDQFIYDIDCRWPGSTHDSRVWNRSEVKHYVEQQRTYYIAGDSGYPISEVLMKPYSTAEAGRERRKRLFNKRLSGLRTVMSENLYGVWKRRFPVLKSLRTHFELSQKIVVATGVLFNIGRFWGDDTPEEGEEAPEGGDDDQNRQGLNVVIQEGDPGSVRVRGQVERDRLKDNMIR